MIFIKVITIRTLQYSPEIANFCQLLMFDTIQPSVGYKLYVRSVSGETKSPRTFWSRSTGTIFFNMAHTTKSTSVKKILRNPNKPKQKKTLLKQKVLELPNNQILFRLKVTSTALADRFCPPAQRA